MIPARRRACLPAGHWWIAHQEHGRLVVTVSTLVPPDSPLEHELVSHARRAWQQHKRRGLVLLPAPIVSTESVSWLVRQLRRPTVAASAAAAAAGVALAVVVPIVEPPTRPQGRPVIAAPPVRPARTPGRGTAPHRPAKPAPKAPAPQRPVSHPDVVVAVSSSQVHVEPARLPVRLPVRLPPVHMRPPRVPVPPVTTPPVASPVTAMQCRLVRLELRVTRVCL